MIRSAYSVSPSSNFLRNVRAARDSTNSKKSSEMTHDPPPQWTITLECVALAAIVVTAITGNLCICIATLYKRNLRTSTNLWVAALAASDLVRSCVAAPLTINALMESRWNFGAAGCFLQGFFTYFLSLVSLLTMAFMAVNRYVRVVRPQLYKKIFTTRRSAVMISTLWAMLAFSVSLPVLLGWAEFSFFPGYSACVLRFYEVSHTRIFLVLDAALFLCPCMMIIAACYYRVSRTVHRHNQTIISSLNGLNGRGPNQLYMNVEEIRITRTLFLLVGTFAVCWIPTYVIAFLSRGEIVFIPRHGTLAVTFLVGLNSAINPFIYGATSRSFRQEFRTLAPRCCKNSANQVATIPLGTTGVQVERMQCCSFGSVRVCPENHEFLTEIGGGYVRDRVTWKLKRASQDTNLGAA